MRNLILLLVFNLACSCNDVNVKNSPLDVRVVGSSGVPLEMAVEYYSAWVDAQKEVTFPYKANKSFIIQNVLINGKAVSEQKDYEMTVTNVDTKASTKINLSALQLGPIVLTNDKTGKVTLNGTESIFISGFFAPNPVYNKKTGDNICTICQGGGTTMCHQCGGTGQWTNPATQKTGPCPKCGADGQITCTHCGGDGKYP